MGYYSTRSRRHRPPQHIGAFEIACVVLVAAAVIALIVWMVVTAGGGVLMN